MNGIDFLKSCTTNVRSIDRVFDTQYTVYVARDGVRERSNVSSAVADLRRSNVLCVEAKEELWVFGPLQPELKQLLETQKYSFSVQDGMTIAADLGKLAADGRAVKEVLLDAIQGSITYIMATEHHMTRIGTCAWLFVANDTFQDGTAENSVLVRLQLDLNANGVLFVSTTTAACALEPIQAVQIHAGHQILLAPSGRLAIPVKQNRSDEHGSSKSLMQFNTSWRQKVVEILLAEGIVLDANEKWIMFQLVEDGANAQHWFLWPRSLCFTASPHFTSHKATAGQEWQQWFGGTDDDHVTYSNPIADADEWFHSCADREKAAKTAAESKSSVAESANHMATTMVAETPLATSPPFNQRLIDQQLAMAGIYPTPPDGLMPGSAAPLLTSDGSAGNLQGELISGNDEMHRSNGDEIQAGRDSFGSSVEAQAFQQNSDDLFGDMGEIGFGTNEVGDADFDYFDEPDDLPQATTGMDDVEMTDDVHVEHTVVGAERDHDEGQLEPDDIAEDAARSTSSQEVMPMAAGSPQGHQDVEPSNIVQSDTTASVVVHAEPEKALSPFGIRERLLPPPIPASASASASDTKLSIHKRQSSTFEPILFNEHLELTSKYADSMQDVFITQHNPTERVMPDISLPNKRKWKHEKNIADPDSGVTDMDTSSEEDSRDSIDSLDEDENVENLPPTLPWDTKKRKRLSVHAQSNLYSDSLEPSWSDEESDKQRCRYRAVEKIQEMLGAILHPKTGASNDTLELGIGHIKADAVYPTTQAMEELFELTKQDLVYIAQIVSEQAISAVSGILASISNMDSAGTGRSTTLARTLQSMLDGAVENILPGIDSCSVAKLALAKEPPQRPMTNPGKAPQTNLPRQPQREGSMHHGPDWFNLPPPHVRVQRGADTWEMLPPALNFWDALGLGPVSGAKDITVIDIVPGNMDLANLMDDFVRELGSVYESHKLGSFTRSLELDNALYELESYEDGHVFIGLEDEIVSFEAAVKAYAQVCTDLGGTLADASHFLPDRTIVILLVDPFEDDRARHFLSACFWLLCKAYRDALPKASHKTSRSDLVLQILPASLLATLDSLVLLEAEQVATLAKEIYDRCPPSSKAAMSLDTASALPIIAAPAIELATIPTKRIAFHLSPDPPSDLLNEGSVLHLAYALSADREWLTTCWTDSTGRYHNTSATCLRGKSFKDVAGEIWEKTTDILMAREVTWRIFILTSAELEASVQQCWRSLAASKRRRQMLHVTLLSIQPELSMQFSPPDNPDGSVLAGNTPGHSGFLTPSSTPQATHFTVSPDPSGPNNAPPTPGATETAANIAETDPDAHLVDIRDESCGMLLALDHASSSKTRSFRTHDSFVEAPALAHGVLLRRGDLNSPVSKGHLESAGVRLHWEIRVRPSGTVDEGPAKQAEASLREVLRMFRSLSLLTRVRHLDWAVGSSGCHGGCPLLPFHIASAMKASEALDGFL